MDNTRKGFKLTSTNKDKRIAELEKVCQDLSDKFDYQVKQVMKLEKENAELKEALKGKVCKCMTYFNFKDLEKELTKAKKLLQFVSEYEDMTCYADELEEIKQFLKEVEK